MSVELTEPMIETIQSAARKLTGFRRRQFQAEVAERDCDGVPRRAEAVFGWGRAAVQLGLHERRTGLRCVEDFSSRGRRKTEDQFPRMERGDSGPGQLRVVFDTSRDTSNFVADGLERWWAHRQAAHPHVRRLIPLDNDPEIGSARTPFLKRLGLTPEWWALRTESRLSGKERSG